MPDYGSDIIRALARQNLALAYPERSPTNSEQQFFDASGVPAYAAEDGAPVVSESFDGNRQSLLDNERYRLAMFGNGLQQAPYLGSLPMTASQAGQFPAGNKYASPHSAFGQQSMVARYLAGDPSARDVTDEQKMAAMGLATKAALGGLIP